MFFNASISSCRMRNFSFFFCNFLCLIELRRTWSVCFSGLPVAKDNSLKEAADERLCRTYGDKIK